MSLIKQLEALKDQPNEIVMGEDKEKEQPKKESPEKEHEVEIKSEEDAEAPEDAEEEKEESDATSGYQRRKVKEYEREAQSARERAERAEKMLAEIALNQSKPRQEAEVEPKKEVKKAPDPNEDPDGYRDFHIGKALDEATAAKQETARLKQEQAFANAERELERMERKSSKKDYDDAVEHGIQAEIKRQKFVNPNLTDYQIRKSVEREKVILAAKLEQRGEDPVDGIYDFMVKVYGYEPKSGGNEGSNKNPSDNLDAVRKNKAKSASLLSSGKAQDDRLPTKDAVRKITPAQFSKLSKAERDRLFRD